MEIIIFIILLSIILVWIWFWILKFIQIREDYKRTLSLTFLKITMPKKDSDLD